MRKRKVGEKVRIEGRLTTCTIALPSIPGGWRVSPPVKGLSLWNEDEMMDPSRRRMKKKCYFSGYGMTGLDGTTRCDELTNFDTCHGCGKLVCNNHMINLALTQDHKVKDHLDDPEAECERRTG